MRINAKHIVRKNREAGYWVVWRRVPTGTSIHMSLFNYPDGIDSIEYIVTAYETHKEALDHAVRSSEGR